MPERSRQWLLGGLILALLGVATLGLLRGPAPEPDRVATLESRLRCPTCKTVSIAESPSQTAADMRRIVAEQVAAGRSDEEIVGYFTGRYGPWVLLDPPRSGITLLLWLLPLVAAGCGVLAMVAQIRRSRSRVVELSEEDQERVRSAFREYRRSAEVDQEP